MPRDYDHYRNIIQQADTVGHQLLARAVYAGRHGDADTATNSELAEIVRSFPSRWSNPMEAKRAMRTLNVWRWTPERLAARLGPDVCFELHEADDPEMLVIGQPPPGTLSQQTGEALHEIAKWPDEAPWAIGGMLDAVSEWRRDEWIDAGLELDPVPPWAVDMLAQ
jgi:hypothetical protein